MGWIGMSVIAMFTIIPSWLSPGFFEKNFGVRPEIFMMWYFFWVSLGSAFFLHHRGVPVVPPFVPWILMAGVSIAFGIVTNILVFTSVPLAPNPGLVQTIVGASSVGVFFSALILSRILPEYFNKIKFDGYDLLGMAIVITGLFVMVRPR